MPAFAAVIGKYDCGGAQEAGCTLCFLKSYSDQQHVNGSTCHNGEQGVVLAAIGKYDCDGGQEAGHTCIAGVENAVF